MSNTKHTKGSWTSEGQTFWLKDEDNNDIECISVKGGEFGNTEICAISYADVTLEEGNANAKLIVEVGEVTNQTGYTPKQLLKHRNDLLDELENCRQALYATEYEKAVQYFGGEGSKGASEKAIHSAETRVRSIDGVIKNVNQ